MGDLKGEPEMPVEVLALPERGAWATRGILAMDGCVDDCSRVVVAVLAGGVKVNKTNRRRGVIKLVPVDSGTKPAGGWSVFRRD